MSRRIAIEIAALGLAATSLVASLAMGVALAFPATEFANASGLAWVHEARATALLASPQPSGSAQAEAGRQTWMALGSDPANPTSWLRLAYLDSLQPTGLSDEGRGFLARSYRLAPYGPDTTGWRLRFAFNHWGRLDEGLRRQVIDELRIAGRHGGYRALPEGIEDPAGRLAAALTLAPFSRQPLLQR